MGFNGYGGIPISLFVETTSYNDPTLVRGHNNLEEARVRHGHRKTIYLSCDNPHKDGAGVYPCAVVHTCCTMWVAGYHTPAVQFTCSTGVRANLYAGGGKERFRFPGAIVLVRTEEECDAACAKLLAAPRTRGAPIELYWDTESVAYLDGSGTNTNTAALVQICRDASAYTRATHGALTHHAPSTRCATALCCTMCGTGACYLFRVALWASCYASFARLMGDASVVNRATHSAPPTPCTFPSVHSADSVLRVWHRSSRSHTSSRTTRPTSAADSRR